MPSNNAPLATSGTVNLLSGPFPCRAALQAFLDTDKRQNISSADLCSRYSEKQIGNWRCSVDWSRGRSRDTGFQKTSCAGLACQKEQQPDYPFVNVSDICWQNYHGVALACVPAQGELVLPVQAIISDSCLTKIPADHLCKDATPQASLGDSIPPAIFIQT